MPTPAVHLALAERMLEGSDIATVARGTLAHEMGPFLLGHTAPDVRTVSGQKREESHFCTVPRSPRRPACQALFQCYPSLVDAAELSAARAAFMAGYLAHLVLDEIWLDDVLPCFLARQGALPMEGAFLHNVLRTWLDERAQDRLSGSLAKTIRAVEPDGWLPFVDDSDLRAWRDWLSDQLGSDSGMETAEILAGRIDVAPEEIRTLVSSPAEMEKRLFRHLPRPALDAFLEKGYTHSLARVNWYFRQLARQQPHTRATFARAHLTANAVTPKEAST